MTRYAARFGDELRVVAPVPWFPFRAGFGEYSRLARTPYQESRGGVPIYHPRVFIVPKVGMRLAPTAWRMRLRPMLRRLREEWRFDLIDGHYIYPDGVALVPIAAELGVPIVLSARGTDVHLIGNMEGPRQRIRDACARASAVVAVSHALARHLAEIGVPKEAISVVQNGADVDAFAPPRDRAPEKLGPGRVLLGIGRLVPQKGFHLAIQAMARLLPKYPDLQLFLAGDGAERARLEALVASLGLGARVRFSARWSTARSRGFCGDPTGSSSRRSARGIPMPSSRRWRRGSRRRDGDWRIPEIVDPEIGEIAERPDLESFERALDRSLSRSFDPAASRAAPRGSPLGALAGFVTSGLRARRRRGAAVPLEIKLGSVRILYHHRTAADDGQAVHIRELQGRSGALGHEVDEVALVKRTPGAVRSMPSILGKLADLAPGFVRELAEHGYDAAGRRALRSAITNKRPDFLYERYALSTACGVEVAKESRLPFVLEVNSPLVDEVARTRGLQSPGGHGGRRIGCCAAPTSFVW